MPLFTILVPTHDHADTLIHSVASAQRQSCQDFEILVVGDGAPPRTAEVMARIAAADSRVRYLPFTKGERHGERNRHEALQAATGEFVAYLADDDLWAPEHLETLRPALEAHDLVHTMHFGIFPDGTVNSWYFDARLPYDLERMRRGETGIGGLASAAHRMDAYRKLPEGWRAAPPGMPTDQHFWLQFLEQPWCRYLPIARHTVFHFASPLRSHYNLASRVAELAEWSEKIRDGEFRQQMSRKSLERMVVAEHAKLSAASPKHLGPVVPGRRLEFAQGRGNDGYLLSGFSVPEPWGCWSVGETALVFLPLASPPPSDMAWTLRLTLQPFVHPPQRPAATFRIFVNGKALFEETASRSDARNLEIPLADVDLQRACYLSIRIEVDRPVSPHGLGVSQDHRALGVGLIACEIAQFRKPRAALPKEARRYYFLHIPKTAGTSLNQWLTDTGEFDICPEGLWSLLLKRDRQELLSHSMYCGHFYRPLAAYLGCRLTTFTFLRNPLERAVSHHRHVLRDPHHYFHDYAARLGSFEAFARDPITRPLVDNFQVRSLSARFDPAQIAATLPPAAAEKYPLERTLETAATGMSTEMALAEAKAFLGECAFVGIAEQMAASTARLARVLKIVNVPIVSRQNVDPKRASMDASRFEMHPGIEDILWADWELYRFALDRFASHA